MPKSPSRDVSFLESVALQDVLYGFRAYTQAPDVDSGLGRLEGSSRVLRTTRTHIGGVSAALQPKDSSLTRRTSA